MKQILHTGAHLFPLQFSKYLRLFYKQPKDSLPVDGIVKESKQRREPDPHTLRVFDLDKQEWRSFKMDRVQKIGAQISFTDK